MLPAPNDSAYSSKSLRQKTLQQIDALFAEREERGWDADYKEIAQFVDPRSGLFNGARPNDGRKRHQDIYDSTGLRARRIATAGMMSGHASPARPFHRLKVPDEKLMKRQTVKIWLDQVTRLQRLIWSKSNTYFALQKIYRECVTFGTAVSFLEPNFDTVIHHTPLTVGEYALGRNHLNHIDTLARRFKWRVIDVVRNFGLEKCSISTQNAYNRGNFYAWVDLGHLVAPREWGSYNARSPLNRDMKFKSCWAELSSADIDAPLLRESGFKNFPALTPRWDTSSGATYGESPGMEVVGDIKQLMFDHMRKAQGIDYQTNPPIQVPTTYKADKSSRLPGGMMFYDPATGSGNSPIKSAYEVTLNLQYVLEDIQDIRQRINEGFFVDLFMMIANIERSNVTAREIAEKQEEKLIMLGPVIENLDAEVLVPLVDFTFDRMVEARILPTPPPELADMELQVEFIGVLAQAQRAVGISSADRLIGSIAAIAQLKGPDVLDKLDSDAMIDDYADMLGGNPEWIVANEDVAIIRQDRAKAQAQQAQMAAMQPMANAAKTASETNVTAPSALTSLMGYQ